MASEQAADGLGLDDFDEPVEPLAVPDERTAVTDQNYLTLNLSREDADAVLRILEAEAHRRASEFGGTYAEWAESSHEALSLAMTCYYISDWLASLRDS